MNKNIGFPLKSILVALIKNFQLVERGWIAKHLGFKYVWNSMSQISWIRIAFHIELSDLWNTWGLSGLSLWITLKNKLCLFHAHAKICFFMVLIPFALMMLYLDEKLMGWTNIFHISPAKLCKFCTHKYNFQPKKYYLLFTSLYTSKTTGRTSDSRNWGNSRCLLSMICD